MQAASNGLRRPHLRLRGRHRNENRGEFFSFSDLEIARASLERICHFGNLIEILDFSSRIREFQNFAGRTLVGSELDTEPS